MTLGVAGTLDICRDIVNGGKAVLRMIPMEMCDRSRRFENRKQEWRCLSFREYRMVVNECVVGVGGLAIESSEGKGGGSERVCTALLMDVMVTFSVPERWHERVLRGGDD